MNENLKKTNRITVTYTQVNSKVGILARRRLEFEEAKLIVEAAQLRPKLGDGDNFKINGCPTLPKTNLRVHLGIFIGNRMRRGHIFRAGETRRPIRLEIIDSFWYLLGHAGIDQL